MKKLVLLAVGAASALGIGLRAQSYTFSTASTAFYAPAGIAVDSSRSIYVAGTYSNTVAKLSPAGTLLTQYGSGSVGSIDGTGTSARFYSPHGLALDSAGNLYVADTNNHLIRKITPAGVVSTLAGTPGVIGSLDGPAATARFNYPQGIAIDSTGNLFVTDTTNHTIRKITPAGVVSTVAGTAGIPGSADGTGSTARFFFPQGITIDGTDNLYVADTSNHTIRKITPVGGVTTVAGSAGNFGIADGPVAFARFSSPNGVAADAVGNLFVTDGSSYIVRKISGGVVSTIAGLANSGGDSAGVGSAARFYGPRAIVVDSSGNLFVADSSYVKIGTPSSQLALTVQPLSLNVGSGSTASFSVTATGATPITYQWQKNGTPISGATNSALTIPAVQAADAATYTVTVNNSVGTLASTGATLTVLAPVPNDNFANAETITGASGSVNGNNNGATGEPGEPVQGSIVATASSVWYKWTPADSGTAVFNFSGAFQVGFGAWVGNSLSSLTRVASGTSSRASFRVQGGTTYYLAIGSTSTTRGNFSMNWRTILNDDIASAQPLSGNSGSVSGNNDGATAEAGEPSHFSGTSSSSTSVWYRWTASQDGVATFETTGTFNTVIRAYRGNAVTALQEPEASSYIVSGTNGRSQLFFVARSDVTYSIVVGSYNFSTGPFTLTWQFTQAPVIPTSGQTTASATVPVNTTSFTSVQALAGTNVTLSIGPMSAGPVTMQWRRDGSALAGRTDARITLTGVQPADAGTYTAVVTNAAGSATSNPVVITVITPPANDNFASAATINGLTGQTTGTNVNATGENGEPAHWNLSGTASSVWYKWTPTATGLAAVDTVGSNFDTVLAVYTGTTLANLSRLTQDDDRGGGRTSLVTFAATAGTTYYIAVGGATSSARGSITLNWQLTAVLAVTTPPANQTVAAGGSATFSVTASGAGVTYQWNRNGVAIPGATNATLTVSNLQAGADASYTVTITNSSGTRVTSDPATLTVTAPAIANFTIRNSKPDTGMLWSIAANGDTLVACGDNGVILSSSDKGRTWAPSISGNTAWLVAVTYGGGQFVIVGEGGRILTSPDGIIWTNVTTTGTTERLNNVIFADGKYVAIGEHGACVTSSDSRVWTPRTTPVNTWLHGLAYNPSIKQFATAGENGVFLYSADAVTWNRLPVPNYTGHLHHIAAVDGYANFVTVGDFGKAVSVRQNQLVLKDGSSLTTWSADVYSTNVSNTLIGLVQGAGALFAMGEDGQVITANQDRGPWVSLPSPAKSYLTAGIYHQDTIYIVGLYEMVLQSDPIYISRLRNISTRGVVGTGSNIMISGFIIEGTGPKQVLVRAAGPTLASSFGLTGTLAAPVLTLVDAKGTTVASNTGWSTATNAATVASTAARVSAFPFPQNSADSALVTTLNPGAYTALVSGVNNGTGISIVEVYDTDVINNSGPHAINISTRGVVGTGADKLIAGFIIDGASARRVLIRAVGPGLAAFGVNGTLAEPQLELYNGKGLLQATAGAWGLQPNADEIRGSFETAGAFKLTDGSKDSAMVVTLLPGNWTVQVSDANSGTGVAIIEVYALP